MLGIVLIIAFFIFFNEQFWEYVGIGTIGIFGITFLVWIVGSFFGLHFDYWEVALKILNFWSVAGIFITLIFG